MSSKWQNLETAASEPPDSSYSEPFAYNITTAPPQNHYPGIRQQRAPLSTVKIFISCSVTETNVNTELGKKMQILNWLKTTTKALPHKKQFRITHSERLKEYTSMYTCFMIDLSEASKHEPRGQENWFHNLKPVLLFQRSQIRLAALMSGGCQLSVAPTPGILTNSLAFVGTYTHTWTCAHKVQHCQLVPLGVSPCWETPVWHTSAYPHTQMLPSVIACVSLVTFTTVCTQRLNMMANEQFFSHCSKNDSFS